MKHPPKYSKEMASRKKLLYKKIIALCEQENENYCITVDDIIALAEEVMVPMNFDDMNRIYYASCEILQYHQAIRKKLRNMYFSRLLSGTELESL